MKIFMKYFLSGLILTELFTIQLVYAKPPADGETPASLACIYGLTPNVPGCPISGTGIVPKTGSGIIAVIEGAHDEHALNEQIHFSNQFGINPLFSCDTNAPPCFQTYYASTCLPASSPFAGPPPAKSGDLEPEIDFEWSHAMAPYASIYVIESKSWEIDDMMQGMQCANTLLSQAGGGIISFSKSYDEFAGEAAYDKNFQTPNIIYLASSGDYYAPARYPSSSPFVISAGGTSIERDKDGKYIKQVAWKNTGIPCKDGVCKTGGSGGPSKYESRPAFQNSVQRIVGDKRGTPDISFAAQGIDVFCCKMVSGGYDNQCPATTTACTTEADGAWAKSGGTSLASPALAGIINSARSGSTSSTQELLLIYNNAIKNYHTYWTDIIEGNNGFPAMQGYDFTTGLGVPRGYGGK